MTSEVPTLGVPPRRNKAKPRNPREVPRWIKVLGILVGAALGIIIISKTVNDFLDARPKFSLSLKQISLFRSDANKVPSALFKFQLENLSTSQYTISVDSIRFNYFNLTYKFKSNNSKNAISGKSSKALLVSESDLFFDTLLSLPFTSETTTLDIFYSYEESQKIAHYDNDNVEKCLFIQSPRIDPRSYYDKLTKRTISVRTTAEEFEGNVYFSPQTAPFVWFDIPDSWTTIRAIKMPLDAQIFEPIYAGIYYYNEDGNRTVLEHITPEQAFGKMSEYNISKVVKKKIDFDFMNTDEFVTIIFDEFVDKDPFHDNRLVPIQIIATKDTTDLAVEQLKEILLSKGLRVEIKQTNLAYILREIAPRSFDGEPYVRSFKDTINAHYEEINSILSNNGIVVFDFDRDPAEFTTKLMGEVSTSGYEQMRLIRIPTRGFSGGIAGRAFEDMSRIFLYRTSDTIFRETWVDSLTGEEWARWHIADKYVIREH